MASTPYLKIVHRFTAAGEEPLLPAGFRYPGNFPAGRQFTETDPAHPKFSDKSPGPSAQRTSIVFSDCKLWFPPSLCNYWFLSQTDLQILSI